MQLNDLLLGVDGGGVGGVDDADGDDGVCSLEELLQLKDLLLGEDCGLKIWQMITICNTCVGLQLPIM